jgi:hypothetical protein
MWNVIATAFRSVTYKITEQGSKNGSHYLTFEMVSSETEFSEA